MVGIHVRVSDAVARDARTGRQLDRADESADRASPDRIWSGAWHPVGRVRIRLQRPRSGIHLPIFEFRRSRSGAETRSWGKYRRRALCHRAGDHGQSTGSGAKFRGARRYRRTRPIRLLRGLGLHAGSIAERRRCCDRARVHGASSGHDDRRHRRCLAGWNHAGAVPCRTHHPGDGIASAGTHAARHCGRSPLGGGGKVGGRDP